MIKRERKRNNNDAAENFIFRFLLSMRIKYFIHLVDARNDSVLDLLAVSLPVFTVLCSALVVISALTVQQENAKIDGVKVRNGCGKSTRQAPGQGHEPITKVVDVARHAPPSRGD